jgi:hypothetical protein
MMLYPKAGTIDRIQSGRSLQGRDQFSIIPDIPLDLAPPCRRGAIVFAAAAPIKGAIGFSP